MKKRFFGILAVVVLAVTLTFGMVACSKNPPEDKYTIVYIGDSIAEALIGPSPLSERDNYGYYALVGRTNGFKYYNHSVSGHKTSTGIVSNEGLLEVLESDTEDAALLKSHLQEADMIHISVLGNNMLQYNLGLLMLEVADPDFEEKYEAGKLSELSEDKTLINALEEGSMDYPLERESVDGTGIVEFAFPPTLSDIDGIVTRLKELNPDATIVFQKVYNPFFEGSKHLTNAVKAKLAEIKDVDGRFGPKNEYITTIEQLRKLTDYLLGRLNGILDMYLEEHEGAFITVDARAAFQEVAELDQKDGKVNLSEDSLGRKCIYEDWTHPSNLGHAIIASMTQDLLDELGVGSPNAVSNYKAIKLEQINRLYKGVVKAGVPFDANAAINAINSANTYMDVSLAYFKAIEGYTPNIGSTSTATNNKTTSFNKTMRFDIDLSKTGLMQYGEFFVTMLKDLLVDEENTFAEFKTDGSMHFQLQTKAGLFGELLDDVFSAINLFADGFDKNKVGEMLADFDISGGVDSMVEPMFPGFKAKLAAGDLKGALEIIERSLGFNIVGLDYENDGVKQILNYVAQNMKLPSNLLDLIPKDTVLKLTFDSQYYVKDVKGEDGKTYTGIFISSIGAREDTQPFAVFNVTYDKNGAMKLFLRIRFMDLCIGLIEAK